VRAGIAAAANHPVATDIAQPAVLSAVMDDILSLPVSTITHIPRAVRPRLAEVLTAELRNGHSAGPWGVVRLWLFAKAVLRVPPRGGRKKRYVVKALLASRLERWSNGDLLELWEEARLDSHHRLASCGPEAVARGNARRALRLAAEGRYAAAIQALGSAGTASPSEPEAVRELRARHPAHPLPDLATDGPPALVVEEDAVLSSLKGFPRGSSPGGSGLRAQHLLDAVAGSTVPATRTCLAELTRWLNALLDGSINSQLAPWVVGAPLTAIRKPTSGVRPIAVGETFRRLASRLCCSAVRKRMPQVFLPSGQLGVGISGGLEAAIHGVRSYLCSNERNTDLCLLKVDMANAFNECSRPVFLEQVRTLFPDIYRWVAWCYTVPGELRFGPHRLISTAGVQQGDPLGPLLFSLVLRDLLAFIGDIDGIDLQLWYLDDGTIIGSRAAVARFLQLLLTHGPAHGLHVNLEKCEVFWPSGTQDFPELPADVKRVGRIQGGLDLLGSPVFGSAEFFESFPGKRVDKVLASQAHLADLDDPQVELHLLRSCLGLCKVVSLLRTTPPGSIDHQLQRFDDGLRSSFSKIMRTSVSEKAWQQAALPVRVGGLGLRSAVRSHAAAFLGSCNLSRDLITFLLSPPQQRLAMLPEVGLPQPAVPPPGRDARVAPQEIPGRLEAVGRLRTALGDIPALPPELQTARQGTLQAALDKTDLGTLLDASSVRDKARLNTLASAHASAWLWAIPNSHLGLTMQRHEFLTALRYWLGIKFYAIDRVRCSCGAVIDSFGDHLLGCSCGPLRIGRHDALRDILFHALLQDCSQVRREQRVTGDSQTRPGDIFHPDFSDGRPGYFDITVRQSLMPCFIARAAVTAGAAAVAGEQAKDHQHLARVEDAGARFFPLVVESLGLWSDSSLEILRVIAARAATRHGWTVARALSNLMQQLSVRLWQYNARMLSSRNELSGGSLWDLPT